MKTRFVVGCATAAVGAAFAFGFLLAPEPPAAASHPAAIAPPRLAVAKVTAAPAKGRPPLPTTRRFEPPPVPEDDPGVGEILKAADTVPPEVLASRWQDTDRRLEELFGPQFPAEKRAAIKTALSSWIRDHARGVRAYYKGNIDQAELADYVHGNLLAYAQSVESTLTREEYRTFMDLEPGADPYITLVPPGTSVGGPVNGDEHAGAEDGK